MKRLKLTLLAAVALLGTSGAALSGQTARIQELLSAPDNSFENRAARLCGVLPLAQQNGCIEIQFENRPVAQASPNEAPAGWVYQPFKVCGKDGCTAAVDAMETSDRPKKHGSVMETTLPSGRTSTVTSTNF